jgi:D-aminoacyl-tRNA deacylase
MRMIIQRVNQSKVLINQTEERTIGKGILVLIGIECNDNEQDVTWLAKKLVQLRVFDDAAGVMNLNVNDIGAEIMIISQFTLHAQTKKGNRPSYIRAAKPETAIPLYENFIAEVDKLLNNSVVTGEFGAHMNIRLENDGPVTIIIDSKNKE